MTNTYNTTLYNGVTSDLKRRVLEHKQSIKAKFSKQYKTNKLIYLEEYIDIEQAIAREKQLKNWHRSWKFNLVRTLNPTLKEIIL